MSLRYDTILLKLSGEALSGGKDTGIDIEVLRKIAGEVKSIMATGVKLALVTGGGNFWRGRDAEGFDRAAADSIGMLATVMNSLALKDVLESEGLDVRVMSALEVPRISELLVVAKARAHLQKGRIVIFAGGTGSPFFSTDTTAALRALEIKAQAVLKATMVDGVYDKDPKKHHDAVRYPMITYLEVLEKNLKVMDSTAISLCMDNRLPIHVFNLWEKDAAVGILEGKPIGTLVKESK